MLIILKGIGWDMLIIFEGIDCSGKSWLAEYILKKGPQPAIYLKQGAKPKNKEVTERTKLEIAYSAMLKAYKNEFEPQILSTYLNLYP